MAAGPWLDVALDATWLTEVDVRAMARRIQTELDEAGYRYDRVLIQAHDFSGTEGKEPPLRYALTFRQGDDLAKTKIRTYR